MALSALLGVRACGGVRRCAAAAARLLFCTTGVLLRRLVGDSLLRGVSHVLVDEIHERGMSEDFLLIVLRDLLPRRPDLKARPRPARVLLVRRRSARPLLAR
eukprot:SAG11_NODE_1273_length_5332_cov_9.483088_4_plen_102_part_00